MKKSTREAIRFLNQEYGIDEATAYAYLSAATDFENKINLVFNILNTKLRSSQLFTLKLFKISFSDFCSLHVKPFVS
jgi:hypothetical protein